MSRRHKPVQAALALCALTALAFQGCGGADEVHQADAHGGSHASGGTAGASHASGGASGTHAGTNGMLPGAGSSAGGSAASGGDSGEAGVAQGGATAGMANGGDAGIANVGGGGALPFDVDPACHCQLLVDNEFQCTLRAAEFAKRLPIPTDCSNDLNQVTRVTCDDGTTTYRWEEGGENEYTVQLSKSGQPLYGRAFGYVGALCGIPADPTYDLGSIEAGNYSESECFDECSVCEGDSVMGAAGAGGAGELPACSTP